MRVRFWMKTFLIVPALSLIGFAAAAQQQGSSQQTGDPVADAARKARESKKDAPKPKKVYTDDDLKPAAPEPAAPTTASGRTNETQATGQGGKTAAKAGDKAEGDDTPKEDPNGEAAWRKRFQAQHSKIAKAERELDILSRELEKAQVEYYPDPQKAMAQQNTRADINGINAKIDAKKAELAQLKQGLDDLEDQLRKSGGDPGWAR
jgi:chromosome segregation ATPase